MLNSGLDLVVDSEIECCVECKKMKKCNVWVFCAFIDGCGNEYYDYKFGECWLKKFLKEDVEMILVLVWECGENVIWISGVVGVEVMMLLLLLSFSIV